MIPKYLNLLLTKMDLEVSNLRRERECWKMAPSYWWCYNCGDLDVPYKKNDMNLCPKCVRGILSTSREKALVNFLNGISDIPEGMFPCKLKREDAPYDVSVKHAGGLGLHYDFVFENGERVEQKITSKKGSPRSILRFQPWKDTVQFLQGQVKSQLGIKMLGDCGEPMLRGWWENAIDPSIPYEDYKKAMYDFRGTSCEFIRELRKDKALQKEIQAKWLTFEETWFDSHAPVLEHVKEVVESTLSQKDWWLCVSKSGAEWIRGPRLLDLRYVGTKNKKMGGKTFLFEMLMEQEGEEKTIPLELKFHWKNGGQGVQNLNFMLL
jgi:hypothetical protein